MLLIIIPTRSRPENVAKAVKAWEDTDAFRHARPLFVIDVDDPRYDDYLLSLSSLYDYERRPIQTRIMRKHEMLVPKLNHAVRKWLLTNGMFVHFNAIGFAGDDHLPRTRGWARRYLEAIEAMGGTGVVSCPDGYRRDDLPTQWAMGTNLVRQLNGLVPAPVEHLYCDDSVRDVAKAIDRYSYLDDVMIEHMHPVTGKVKVDDQYKRVNSKEQFEKDRAAYEVWRSGAFERDVDRLRRLLTTK